MEWAELEKRVSNEGQFSQVKAFMSAATDVLRPAYARSIQRLKRASVIAGTTNEVEFLADSTGKQALFGVVSYKGQRRGSPVAR